MGFAYVSSPFIYTHAQNWEPDSKQSWDIMINIFN